MTSRCVICNFENGSHIDGCSRAEKPKLMTKNDDIKVGDIVVCKIKRPWFARGNSRLEKCTVAAKDKRFFLTRYLVEIEYSSYYYKKYRWQLFKINN